MRCFSRLSYESYEVLCMVAVLMVRFTRSTMPLVFGVPGLVSRWSMPSPHAWSNLPSFSVFTLERPLNSLLLNSLGYDQGTGAIEKRIRQWLLVYNRGHC